MIITICLLNHISIICLCMHAALLVLLQLLNSAVWVLPASALVFAVNSIVCTAVLPTSALYAPVFTASSVLCILPAFALCALMFLAFLLLNIALYILPTCMYFFSSGTFSNLAFLCLASLCSSCSGVASASFSSSYQKFLLFLWYLHLFTFHQSLHVSELKCCLSLTWIRLWEIMACSHTAQNGAVYKL